MAKDKATVTPITCKSCGRILGAEVKCLPFFMDDGDNGEKTKHEAFCPRCAVYVRGLRLENRDSGALRFQPGTLVPLRCLNERHAGGGVESVSVGEETCMQCGSRHVLVLPPEVGVA